MKEEVLTTFIKTCENYPANSNSLHKMGTESKKLENAATKQILDVLNISNKEVIYTSSRCESNNLLIFGLLEKYKGKHKKIIITKEEDSSILESLKNVDHCFEIIYLNRINNKVSIGELKNSIDKDTILISISNIANFDEIINLKNEYICFWHTELNDNIDLELLKNIDFLTIYNNDLLGISCLIKNKNIELEPLFHGGKSSTIYRSGTPSLPFIVSFSKLIKLKYRK